MFTDTGCITCHSVTGEKKYGPILNTVYNKKIMVVRNNIPLTITANKSYIIRSIKTPEFEKVSEFSKRKMPRPDLSDEDIENLANYIISTQNAR